MKYLFCLLDKVKDKIKERDKEKEREKKKHKVMNEIKKENGEVKILLKSKFILSDFSCTMLTLFSILIGLVIKIRNVTWC